MDVFSRYNDAKTLLVWVNEEDHMRIISMEKGGNLKHVYERFYEGLQTVSFMYIKIGNKWGVLLR